jgi:MYXO-CTERM domain-containing protein
MKQRPLGSAAALALAASLVGLPALANGRFPAAGQIAVDPSDPSHLVVRTTYGLTVSSDHGAHWSWVCEAAVGYSGTEDPMMAITADGTLIAGIFEGLSASHDKGCQWDFAQGGLKDRYVIDLATEKVSPKSAVLLISNSVGGSMFLTELWETKDNAATWTVAGVDMPADFLGLTLDAAPADPNRVYVSGRYGKPGYDGAIERSNDRGATWQKLLIPGSNDLALPYIGGIDPQNPDVVYVRLDAAKTDKLIVTKDGGTTWQDAFTSTGNLLGFAISPDGATVAVGGDTDGVWTAPASTLSFTQVSKIGARCLTWTPAGLYACGDEFVDGFAVGLSTNQGKTFTPVMHLQENCGPLTCGAATSNGSKCPDAWGATKLTIGGATCNGAGGSGSTSAASSTSTGAAATSTSSGGSAGSSGGGCSVSAPATAAGMAVPGLVLAAAALTRRRRRDARASRSAR